MSLRPANAVTREERGFSELRLTEAGRLAHRVPLVLGVSPLLLFTALVSSELMIQRWRRKQEVRMVHLLSVKSAPHQSRSPCFLLSAGGGMLSY